MKYYFISWFICGLITAIWIRIKTGKMEVSLYLIWIVMGYLGVVLILFEDALPWIGDKITAIMEYKI